MPEMPVERLCETIPQWCPFARGPSWPLRCWHIGRDKQSSGWNGRNSPSTMPSIAPLNTALNSCSTYLSKALHPCCFHNLEHPTPTQKHTTTRQELLVLCVLRHLQLRTAFSLQTITLTGRFAPPLPNGWCLRKLIMLQRSNQSERRTAAVRLVWLEVARFFSLYSYNSYHFSGLTDWNMF